MSTRQTTCRTAHRFSRVEELDPNFYREAHGQTMHFFGEEYCHDAMRAWTILDLSHHELRGAEGAVFKCVWRCVAQKPLYGEGMRQL